MEGADQVLALGRVDAGLAADRGIHLRQQRGRHLHEAYAAAHDAGGKAGEVADDAAAQGDDDTAALQAHLQQALAQARERREALGRLARRQHLRAGMRPAPRAPLERREVTLGDVLVGDDGALGGAEARSQSAPAARASRPGPISTS